MASNGKRMAFVLALAAGRTVKDASREAGIGERTGHRWARDETIRQRVVEVRAELFERALGRLSASATEAVDRLQELLGSESDSVALSAARLILELGQRLREHVDLEARLTKLEAKYDAQEQDQEAGTLGRRVVG